MAATVIDLQERIWRRDHDAVHEALEPFVVWEPWPHPGEDTPADLLRLYHELTLVGYAQGWM